MTATPSVSLLVSAYRGECAIARSDSPQVERDEASGRLVNVGLELMAADHVPLGMQLAEERRQADELARALSDPLAAGRVGELASTLAQMMYRTDVYVWRAGQQQSA